MFFSKKGGAGYSKAFGSVKTFGASSGFKVRVQLKII